MRAGPRAGAEGGARPRARPIKVRGRARAGVRRWPHRPGQLGAPPLRRYQLLHSLQRSIVQCKWRSRSALRAATCAALHRLMQQTSSLCGNTSPEWTTPAQNGVSAAATSGLNRLILSGCEDRQRPWLFNQTVGLCEESLLSSPGVARTLGSGLARTSESKLARICRATSLCRKARALALPSLRMSTGAAAAPAGLRTAEPGLASGATVAALGRSLQEASAGAQPAGPFIVHQPCSLRLRAEGGALIATLQGKNKRDITTMKTTGCQALEPFLQ